MKIAIKKAEYLGNYRIKLLFSDKIEKIIDFKNFITNAKNPMTKKYLDEILFSNFKIEYGDLIWNDFELCFPVWDLYENKI